MPLSATVIGDKPKVLVFNDTSRAYMYARTSSDIYVELCEEDKTGLGDEYKCAKLIKSMHGTRSAAHDWQSEVMRTLKDLGFKREHFHACSGTGKETSKH